MYFCVCGAPTIRSRTVLQIATHLLRAHYPELPSLYANENAELIKVIRTLETKAGIFFFDFPDAVVSKAILHGQMPILALSEPVEQIVPYCMAAWGQDLPSALRFATRSLSSIAAMAGGNQALHVDLGRPDLRLVDLLEIIARHFRIPVDRQIAGQLQASLGISLNDKLETIFQAQDQHGPTAVEKWAAVSSHEKFLVAAVAAGYDRLMLPGPDRQLIWPGELFFRAADPLGDPREPMELTGPARILAYGPYLHLPKGDWLAEIRFEISGNHSGNAILVEVTAGSDILSSGQGRLPTSGILALKVAFAVAAPDIPLEIRSVLPTGAIEGRFRFLEILLRPI